MILFEIVGNTEAHAIYKQMESENGSRQYSFLQSAVTSALQINHHYLSSALVKALNFHAIACLHPSAGEYRPCAVFVGDLSPPADHRVPALMEDLVNFVNRYWQQSHPVWLGAYVLWRLNYIHPFINGNGRTARAICHFVICVKAGGWLPGEMILPELLHQNRDRYVQALKKADESLQNGALDLSVLTQLLEELLKHQLASAPQNTPAK